MSLSDGGAPMLTMPVSPTNNGGGFGWGGDGAWLIILFLIFAVFGWGGNSWGNNGNSGGVVDGYVLTSDFANVERKIDSVNQGLCDGFYQQAQLVNGTNMAMANGFAQAELSPQQPAGGADAAAQRHADAEPGVLLREPGGYCPGSVRHGDAGVRYPQHGQHRCA